MEHHRVKTTIVISFFLCTVGCTNKYTVPNNAQSCRLQTCHGLDISCGFSEPIMCTEIYMVGDKCLAYASCAVQNGECKQVENPKFNECKTCVQHCNSLYQNDSEKLLDCELSCPSDVAVSKNTPAP